MPTRIRGREPIRGAARPSRMRRLALPCAALVLLFTACSSATDDPGTATDPESTASPTPTASPTVGTYPAYGPQDYSYTLMVSCFCLGAGAPIAVTVVGGEVTTAVYAEGGGRGAEAGQPVDQSQRLTIDDVIDRANDTSAAEVSVDWPAGQDYPSSVRVDGAAQVADDEIGYEISDVVPAT